MPLVSYYQTLLLLLINPSSGPRNYFDLLDISPSPPTLSGNLWEKSFEEHTRTDSQETIPEVSSVTQPAHDSDNEEGLYSSDSSINGMEQIEWSTAAWGAFAHRDKQVKWGMDALRKCKGHGFIYISGPQWTGKKLLALHVGDAAASMAARGKNGRVS